MEYGTPLGQAPEAGLLNQSSCLAPALGVTKVIIVRDMILVTLCCATYVGLRCSTNPPLDQDSFRLHGATVTLPELEVFPHNSVNMADAREPLLKGKALYG